MKSACLRVVLAVLLVVALSWVAFAWLDEGWVLFGKKTMTYSSSPSHFVGTESKVEATNYRRVEIRAPLTGGHYDEALASTTSGTGYSRTTFAQPKETTTIEREVYATASNPCVRTPEQRSVKETTVRTTICGVPAWRNYHEIEDISTEEYDNL